MIAAYQLRNIEQSYNGNVVLALDEYMIESKRVTALVGPNGSGKSTLMDILALIQRPQRGQLEFFSRESANKNYLELQQQIGYVQQKPYLFNLTVEQNIGLGLKLRGIPKQQRQARVDAIIKEFALCRIRNRRGNDLSGGEAQRVALARTLILNPRVLILDEPFSHVDKQFRVELERMLRTIRERGEQTVIFSTHDQSQAETLADHVLNLQEKNIQPGRVVNLFRGEFIANTGIFNTGKIQLHIDGEIKPGSSLIIESSKLKLSRAENQTAKENQFLGRIKNLAEESGQIRVTIEAGEIFQASISPDRWRALSLNIGDQILLSCELSSADIINS